MSKLTPRGSFTSCISALTRGACLGPTAALRVVGEITALQMKPLRPAAAAQFNPDSIPDSLLALQMLTA